VHRLITSAMFSTVLVSKPANQARSALDSAIPSNAEQHGQPRGLPRGQ
jgi:hypothetical protein